MKKPPERIKKADNEIEIDRIIRKQKKHVRLAPLFNFLKERRAWGSDGVSLKTIAEIMYEYEPAEDKPKSTLPPKSGNSSKRSSYGEGRLENLKSGYRPTSGERHWFHWAFANAMNKDWQAAVNSDQLVELPLDEVFQLGFAASLPWPDSLDCSVVLKALDHKYSSSLTITPRDWPVKLGGIREAKRDNLEYDKTTPVLEKGYSYLLDVANLETPISTKLFVFESSGRPMKMIGGNEKLELFVISLVEPHNKIVEITDIDTDTQTELPYHITEYTGEFTFHALTFPWEWDFETVFDVSLDQKNWNSEISRKFLRNLQLKFQKHSEHMQLASYSYLVE